MKKTLLLSVLALTGLVLFAQEKKDVKFESEALKTFKTTKFRNWELGVALQSTSIVGDGESWDGSLLGAFIGIRTSLMNFSERVGVDAGLGYSMQGGKYKTYQYVPGGGSENGSASVRLNYIVMPVTTSFRSRQGFFAEAGLQPAVLLSAKDKHNGQTDDVKDEYSGFDLGLIAGAGFESKNKIGAGVRVVPGLMNINKSSGTYSESKNKNMVVSVRATYKL